MTSSAPADLSPSASLRGLDGVNFFLAAVLAGFGPYVAVYLADQKWTQEKIGFVLSASALAGLLSQVPGGELLDSTRSKRMIVALGVLVVALSAMILEFRPSFPLVLIGLTLEGITGGILGPAIAAISLGLVGHAALPERLGRNQRFASTGSLAAAALMGLIGYAFSYQAIFFLVIALALPLFVALGRIHAADIHFGRSCGAPDHHTPDRPARAGRASLRTSPGLLVLGACLFLFQLANASMLPLVGEALIYQGERRSSLFVSALIVLPQIVVAVMAPWVGRQANNWGRRPLLLIGLGALPIRAFVFAFITNPPLLLAFQLLDGISGAVVGVLTALVIADLTNGTGRFNLAQGLVGTASGIGASLSTAIFGLIAASLGRAAVFLSIASVALAAVLILLWLMPETRPSTRPIRFSHAKQSNLI
ncbi:MAG TPA: MFS transporter [Xanthobacteraceae bacterium]